MADWSEYSGLAERLSCEHVGHSMSPAQVREHRLALGLTQAEMARALGLREECVWRWENGKKRPSKQSVHSIRMLAFLPRLFLYAIASGSSVEIAATEPERVLRMGKKNRP